MSSPRLPSPWPRAPRALALLLGLLGCGADAEKDVDDVDNDQAEDGGGGADGADPTTDLTWHQDIAPIFSQSCQGCHGATGGSGGLDLSTPAQAAEWALPIAAAVEARRMPPWTAADDCTTYQGDFSLSAEDRAKVVEWARGGAPAGDPATAAALPPAYTPPVLDRVDLQLALPVDYTPDPSQPDDYRCFLVDWPWAEDAWVTGTHIRPTNEAIAHHVITFLIPPEDVATYEALDAADPAPGYRCYGGPGGDVDSLQTMRWLGAWAPGGGAAVYPEGTGLRVRPGSKLVQQMHYTTLGGGGSDRTVMDLRVETTPQGWADIQPWTDVRWVLGAGMDIPANTQGVSHEFRYLAGAGDRFAFHNAALHMHTMGVSASLHVEHADGSQTCLLREDSWDFNWQRTYALTTPVNVAPGDEIVLRCTWDNESDQDAAWGEGTGDEMCLATTYITDTWPED